MRIRRRNWILKRIVLGFAVAALVAPAAAQARLYDDGNAQVAKGSDFVPGVTDFPSYASKSVKAGDYGMPAAGRNEYLKARDGIEIARLKPRTSSIRSSDLIENVRTNPRAVSSPQLVASPGFDWGDAGIGAGVALGLVLLAGGAVRATGHLGRPQTA